jgi:hypothetical protein
MRSIRFFLLFSTLAAICFSSVAARAGTVVVRLSGWFLQPGPTPTDFFLFHNDDTYESVVAGYWNAPDPAMYLGTLPYLWNDYCSSGPCNVTRSGDMKGTSVEFTTNEPYVFNQPGVLTGIVTSGQYRDSLYSDGVSTFVIEEDVNYNFIGNWSQVRWAGEGTMESSVVVVCSVSEGCSPSCTVFPCSKESAYFLGNLVTTTPEPCSFLLVCTGVLGIARARRRKTANCKLIQWL